MRWEGEDASAIGLDDAQRLAVRVWNTLANGMGGLDWAGLPLLVECLGIDDVEQLVHDLAVIKRHQPEIEKET